ncbi:sugar ABC transporter permease [Streptomyces sp. HUAS MG47]|uniref:sugar ABC transporter permease n=1 Tax=Streptomyces solicamelliae TaxID=3231716 RepID=UPI003878268C
MEKVMDRAAVAAAAASLVRRTRSTAGEVGDRFPLYADPADGRWTSTRRGSWTGGFWAGLLWLTAEADAADGTGGAGGSDAGWDDGEAVRRAREVTERLRERAHDDTDTRALTFWYGAAQGHLRCGDTDAARVALEGAAALVAAAHPRYGIVPAGTGLGRGEPGTEELTVDSAAAVIALLCWAGREHGLAGAEELARRHAAAVRDRCLEKDGGIRPGARLDGAGDEAAAGVWTRGQAWGILALATAARAFDGGQGAGHGGNGYRDAALLAADHWLGRVGDTVPPWSFADPDGLRDTSAAAITAQALLELAELTPGPYGQALEDAATCLLGRLVSGHLRDGMLTDGCYDRASGTATAHELIWGDYFLLSALMRLAGSRAGAATAH